MDQIRISATPTNVVMNPEPTRVVLRLSTGPQGPAGPPAEIYIQQTQPENPQNVGAIWYQTDETGEIQREYVWDGSTWRLTPTGSGITSIVPVAPITASGQSIVTVGVDVATEATAGVVARMATAGDVAAVTPGPAVDAALLAAVIPTATSDLTNDGDGIGGPYVDAAGASAAAPIQSLIAGNDIHISNVGKDFIISAVPNPEHQSDWLATDTGNPAYIKNKPTNVSQFANDAGYITVAESVAAAPVQSVNGMTGAVVIDLSPYATNEDLALTNAKFADYLPLAGGAISGALSVAGAFNVGPEGSARVPTPGDTDVSTAVATTEWVHSLLAATGAIRFMWKYGGFDVSDDPGLGNLNIANGNATIAISKTDGHGNQRYLAPIAPGDTIVLTDNPATGPATEYQRFDVTASPTDNGGWLSIPVSLAGGTSPARPIGEEMRVAIGLDSQAATIDGISAGYGLIGGGISGVVSLAIDTSVVAELSDLPTATGDLTNNGNGTGGPYVDAAGASAAAPVQSIIAGTDIAVVPSGKDFTISFSNATGYITAADIPTNVSAFTNDAGYITLAEVPPSDQADWNESDTGDPAFIRNKPTAISTWSNDVGYITSAGVPTNVSAFDNDAGYITIADVPASAQADWNESDTGDPAFIRNKPTAISTWSNDVGYITSAGVPTNVSAFDNDAGYITLADVPASAQADWNESDTQSPAYILNKPTTVSAFTNDSGYVTQSAIDTTVADYLPLAGGTMTGSIVIPDGTAAVPSLKFNDASGIYQPSDNALAISVGGLAALDIKNGSLFPIYVRPRPEGTNFKGIWSRTYVSAAVGASVSAGLSVLDGIAATTLSSFAAEATSVAGSGTVHEHRGFFAEDGGGNAAVYKAFTSNAKDRRNDPESSETWFCYGQSDAPSYFGGQIQTASGTASLPSVSIFGDEDTGTWSPGANQWAISTGGVERLRATGTGDLLAATGYTPANDQSLATKKYVDDNSGNYVLPIATDSVLGGVKIGDGLTIDGNGVLSLGGTTVVIPDGVDPALTQPHSAESYITVAGSSQAFAGRIRLQVQQTSYPVPPSATGMAVQFRRQGDTDWTLGVVAFSTASAQLADFAAAVATGTSFFCVWSFGGTVGETYETRFAYISATGTGAWTTYIEPLTLAS